MAIDYDKGIDNFMNSSKEKQVLPNDSSDSAAKFLQQGINAYNQKSGSGPGLKEDGLFGPKTRIAAQNFMKNLPPEMKRFAVSKLRQAGLGADEEVV
jgi:hypothetical protein